MKNFIQGKHNLKFPIKFKLMGEKKHISNFFVIMYKPKIQKCCKFKRKILITVTVVLSDFYLNKLCFDM